MRHLPVVFVFLFTAVAYGNEVVSTLLSTVAEKAEQKAELAVNDMFNNIEIELSGFYKGKPSYGISTILPLYEKNNINNFFQGHLSTQADIEMLNLGFVQRRSFFENKLFAGYNFFYDLDLDNSHERFSIGADMLTSLGDVHLNYYDAITDYVVVNGLKEYTLDGFDAQIAFPLPYLPNSKIYAELFSWNGINSSRDLEGETYSVKNNLPYGMTLEFGKTSFDQISRDEEFVTLNINLFELKKTKQPLSSELRKMYSSVPYELYSFSDVNSRKYEKVRRENKIIKQSNRTGTVRIAGY
tara:strand:+ start:207 stop:1100 length:894 start_codon:yes stop_codon:yes gene_type:complete